MIPNSHKMLKDIATNMVWLHPICVVCPDKIPSGFFICGRSVAPWLPLRGEVAHGHQAWQLQGEGTLDDWRGEGWVGAAGNKTPQALARRTAIPLAQWTLVIFFMGSCGGVTCLYLPWLCEQFIWVYLFNGGCTEFDVVYSDCARTWKSWSAGCRLESLTTAQHKRTRFWIAVPYFHWMVYWFLVRKRCLHNLFYETTRP